MTNFIRRYNRNFGVYEATPQLQPVFFHHIPKTAGTTLTSYMASIYSNEMFVGRSEKVIRKNISALPRYRFVSGHISNTLLFDLTDATHIMTIIRDPFKRAISQYKNWRDGVRIQDESDVWELTEVAKEAIYLAQNSDVESFFRSSNMEIIANTRNVYTRAYCQAVDVDPDSDDIRLAEEAFENVRNFLWFGLLDKIDESLSLLSMQLYSPSLRNAALEFHNVSSDSVRLNKSIEQDVKSLNKLDYKLIKLLKREFDDRLKALRVSQFVNKRPKISYDSSTIFSYQADDNIYGMGWSYLEGSEISGFFRWCYGGIVSVIEIENDRCASKSLKSIVLRISGHNIANILREMQVYFNGFNLSIFDMRFADSSVSLHFGTFIPIEIGSMFNISIFSPITVRGPDRAPLGFALSGIDVVAV